MKTFYGTILMITALVAFNFTSFAQLPCVGIQVEAFGRNPQQGSNNYFGVRVTLGDTYDQDVHVYGYIYDEGFPNQNHPFSVNVTGGNLTNQTSDDIYQTSAATNATAVITHVSPETVLKGGVTYCTQCAFNGCNVGSRS